MKIFISLALLFSLLIQTSCSTTEKKQTSIYASMGDKFVTYLLADDYKAAHKMIAEKTAKELTEDRLKKAWKNSIGGLGKFVELKQVYKNKNTENYFIQFEKAIRPLKIETSKDNKLVTVWFSTKYPTNKRSKYIKSFDGFPLNVLIETPVKDPKKIVLFIHGSGPNDWNEGEGELFDRIADSLNKSGIATARFHKRTFEMRLMTYSDPEGLKKYDSTDFDKHFMTYFIKDVNAVANYAKSIFPKAEVILFGHSQGTWIGLQLANQNKNFKKLALLGSYNGQINETILEQSLYRFRSEFKRLDRNKNDELTRWELRNENKYLKQLPVIDTDKDKIISLNEWDAANYINYYKNYSAVIKEWLLQELTYPSTYEILSKSSLKVLFLHGEWDNQTPIYFPKSIQLLNNLSWKKNYSFKFFNKLGHSLNKQKQFLEFNDNPIEKRVLLEVTKEIVAL